ncbi:MAG: heme-binding protein [Eubacteriales bacterium]|nr:heme-binding protein [Eubacteriales bacterium]
MEAVTKTYQMELLEIVMAQEETLRLERFDAADAWQLGLILREKGLETGADLGLHISLLGTQVFHCSLGQPKPNFDHWIARKEKGVLECWKSSLRLKLEALTGGDQLEDHGFTDQEVVFCGGCFPIRLKGLGVVGAVTVSGLNDLQDHQLAVDALAKFMKENVERLPLE